MIEENMVNSNFIKDFFYERFCNNTDCLYNIIVQRHYMVLECRFQLI